MMIFFSKDEKEKPDSTDAEVPVKFQDDTII